MDRVTLSELFYSIQQQVFHVLLLRFERNCCIAILVYNVRTWNTILKKKIHKKYRILVEKRRYKVYCNHIITRNVIHPRICVYTRKKTTTTKHGVCMRPVSG